MASLTMAMWSTANLSWRVATERQPLIQPMAPTSAQ